MEFNILWNSIKRHEGEIFYTVRGLPFTYRCTQKQEIQPFRDGRATWKITRNNLEKAVNMEIMIRITLLTRRNVRDNLAFNSSF